jgi:hypothetical protein
VGQTWRQRPCGRGQAVPDYQDGNDIRRTVSNGDDCPPKEVCDLRALFSTYRLSRKRTTLTKNRIHPLLKENLYGFTREEIFGKASREKIRTISGDERLKFQLNLLPGRLGREEQDAGDLKEKTLTAAAPFMARTGILTSMCGISVFIAIAIVADITGISRFRAP